MDVRYRQYRTGKSQLEFKNSLAFFFCGPSVTSWISKREKRKEVPMPWSGARDHK